MFAVIDCGTTYTRIFIVNGRKEVIASGRKKIGVRDTAITGSRDRLHSGLKDLFYQILRDNCISDKDVGFAIASGMITSEIGLLELPHLVAPVGLEELSEHIEKVTDQNVLPIDRPVYFVRGVRNDYGENARAEKLREIDFMRGEEVQCMGVLARGAEVPCSIVALSSHTKIMYINSDKKIAASNTTISGQFYEALRDSTSIGKSIIPVEGEEAGGYSHEELIEIAGDCVEKAGLGRTLLMPRFLQVLLKTNSRERGLFVNAAIASDDMKAFDEMRTRGLSSDSYIFYGQKSRCEMYAYMLKKRYGAYLKIRSIHEPDEIDALTVQGSIAVAMRKVNNIDFSK
ncbi:MAG: 2-dehydro-3-deoxygalactonokinase [Oscillospiraceae bacterium]